MQEFRVVFDTSEAKSQVDELSRLLETNANDFLLRHGILLDELIENILRLPFDVILRDGGTARGADGVLERRVFIRGDRRFEDCLSALRAGKWNDFIHDLSSKS